MENDHSKWILLPDKIYHTDKRFNKLPIDIQNMLLRYYNRHRCNEKCIFILDQEDVYYCPNNDFNLEEDYDKYKTKYVFGGTSVEFIDEIFININGIYKIGKPSLDI